MLKIKTIEWANFLTYGDYVSKVDINNLGATLIIGENLNSDNPVGNSNGVGKSSFLLAILWCLFGKNADNEQLGDGFINYHTGKDCFVKLTTIDGWAITRTRKVSGKDELIITHNDKDVTLSTNTNAQKFLEKQFNLNYDIFVSSVFFGQKAQSLVNMPRNRRKKILEDIFGIKRIIVMADVARDLYKENDNDCKLLFTNIKSLRREIDSITNQIENAERHAKTFEEDRKKRVSITKKKLEEAIEFKNSLNIPDENELRERWKLVDEIREKIDSLVDKKSRISDNILTTSKDIQYLENIVINTEDRLLSELPDIEELSNQHKKNRKASRNISKLESHIHKLETKLAIVRKDLKREESFLAKLKSSKGTTCIECRQPISGEYTESQNEKLNSVIKDLKNQMEEILLEIRKTKVMITELKEGIIELPISINEAKFIIEEQKRLNDDMKFKKDEIDRLITHVKELKDKYNDIEKKISNSNKVLNNYTPEYTLSEFNTIKSQVDSINTNYNNLRDRLDAEKKAENLYLINIKELEANKVKLDIKISDIENKYNSKLELSTYMKYVKNLYTDARRIKSFLLSNLIPYLNNRIEYYLEAFSIPFKVKFTSELSLETSSWSHKTFSGGESRRIDLSIMFALYDLYISIYGAQCNIMILDEVEGSLDAAGVKQFVDIINENFSSKEFDTIFVVSHKREMLDAFPNKIKIIKDGWFSIVDTNIN